MALSSVDPSSAAFKKARRQYLKTTKNRNQDQDPDLTWTPFRAAEKKYKARFPPPDLRSVLDLAGVPTDRQGDTRSDDVRATRVGTTSSGTDIYTVPAVPGLVLLPSFVSPNVQRRLIRWALRDHTRHPNETNLDAHYILPPEGLWNAHLASCSSPNEDIKFIKTKASIVGASSSHTTSSGPRQLISNEAASTVNFNSLQAISKPPPEPSTSVSDSTPSALVPKLRWANIGWSYHWGTKQYDFSKGKGDIDARVRGLCRSAVREVPWEMVFGGEVWENDDWRAWEETYEPDAGIINFYQTKDTLMAHVDRSEVCATSPLVSISLGNAAIFLIGGLTRDVEPTPILLRSGDVVIMSGPACRRAYHGVPRILENTLPQHLAQLCPVADPASASTSNSDPDEDEAAITAAAARESWQPYSAYMQNARININVRQVFPKGFVPGKMPEI
ncbi:hypothetical protein ID866_4713 [Astraeus odoratus]|nr:hypothetical protein ID866_4713 [Astraeus odoratus]